MLTECCLIDSNIWYYAYIIPTKEDFLEIHNRASAFLADSLEDKSIIISITSYQMAEIIDLLRKGNLKAEIRKDIFESFKTPKYQLLEITIEQTEFCFQKSIASGIHIYDYLTALPLKGMITEIFSADDHFQHKDFKEIAKVTNPLSPWMLREGRIPEKSV